MGDDSVLGDHPIINNWSIIIDPSTFSEDILTEKDRDGDWVTNMVEILGEGTAGTETVAFLLEASNGFNGTPPHVQFWPFYYHVTALSWPTL